jgi:hypothetical protein
MSFSTFIFVPDEIAPQVEAAMYHQKDLAPLPSRNGIPLADKNWTEQFRIRYTQFEQEPISQFDVD